VVVVVCVCWGGGGGVGQETYLSFMERKKERKVAEMITKNNIHVGDQ